MNGIFLKYITAHIKKKQIEKIKKDKNMDDEEAEKLIEEEDIQTKYLQRVSHEGIYNLYD